MPAQERVLQNEGERLMLGKGEGQTVGFPAWVPRVAVHYLAHTVAGHSIRALARAHDCHPSTVLRQVRRLEQRRDDPLVDGALRALMPGSGTGDMIYQKELPKMPNQATAAHVTPMKDGLNQTRIDREALHVLRRLCEGGAVLAVARNMDTAVVVRETSDGQSLRTAVVEREIAQAMALKEWINCKDTEARIARYFITKQGREELRRLTAEDENRALGFRRADHDKRNASHAWDLREDLGGGSRYMVTESPLIGLSRRKDRDGSQFLSTEQVGAGERLRQDYELSHIRFHDDEDWQVSVNALHADLPPAAQAARARLIAALRDLGPGLADVLIQCCCMLEGLEKAEKKLGWSSRSGKIVLRIALTRLIRHYDENHGQYQPLIG